MIVKTNLTQSFYFANFKINCPLVPSFTAPETAIRKTKIVQNRRILSSFLTKKLHAKESKALYFMIRLSELRVLQFNVNQIFYRKGQ